MFRTYCSLAQEISVERGPARVTSENGERPALVDGMDEVPLVYIDFIPRSICDPFNFGFL